MANENWHLSKTIPIAFLVGIAAQTFVLVWYIAGVVNMVEVNSRDIERQDIQVKELKPNHEYAIKRIINNTGAKCMILPLILEN